MVGANTTSVYPCRSCEIPRAHVRANTEKMRDCHLVARTCDNEVGVAINIRDPSAIFYLTHTLLHLKCMYGANYMIEGERWRL